MKKIFFALITVVIANQALLAEAARYNFSFKNKSSQAVQIELIQQIKPITPLSAVQPDKMFTANINVNEPTKMRIHYCPNETWCKTHEPEKMTVRFTPKKPIHISFDGKKVRPQLKRLSNVGLGDIEVIH